MSEKAAQIRLAEVQLRAGGGASAAERQHAKGRWTARERIERLLDHPCRLARHRVPGDEAALGGGTDGLARGGIVGDRGRERVDTEVPQARTALEPRRSAA